MTFREAVDRRIKWLRLPEWTDACRLELHLTADEHVGPWVKLHDEYSSPGKPTPILITNLLVDPESRYVAALSSPPAEKENP